MAKSDTAVKKTRGRPRKSANGGEKSAKSKQALPAGVDKFGFRIGSKKSQAAAMYATKNGATLNEVKEALNSSQFNLLLELEDKFQIDKTKVPGTEGKRQVTRYHIGSAK